MKKRILSILLTLCMVLMLCPVTAFAANDDATELQSLLSGGGTVTLDKDYTIDSTLDVDRTVTLDLNGHVIKMTGSGTVIIIGSQANLTMIDSNNTATHTDSTLPAGGVITGGNATQNGGGVYVGGGCSMTMTGGTIENCSATGGGGVYVFHSGSFTMEDGTIENCSATYGGGVYVDKSTFAMEGGTIENCSAKSGGGGGIYVSSGTFTIGDGEIKNCKSSFGGGGLYIVASGSGGLSTFTMTGGIIENCTSKYVSESAAIFASNSNILANGGIVKDMVYLQPNSTIQTTSSNSYTRFYEKVTNKGTISSGVYYGGIQDSSGTVSGTYHTVSFDSNGGRGSVPTQWFVNTDKATALQPADPTKNGYQAFDGWYNGDTKYDFNLPVTQTITLKAKYGDPKTYNISYDLDGGTATNPTSYTVECDAITLNNPVKPGYTFTGWSGTDLTGENNMTVTIPKESTGDRSYTAHWRDATAPVISGIEDGKTYCDTVEFEVSDNVGVASVTANGVTLTPDANNKYTLEKGIGTVTVVAIDKANNQTSVTVTVNNGHTGGTATCTQKAKCDICGEEYGELANHSLSKTDAKEATCTEDGNIEYWTCSVCHKLFSDENGTNETTLEAVMIKATGHTLTKTEAKDATVTETGNTEYWQCKDCGKYFADENGTKEIKLEDTIISKLSPEIIEGKGQSITAGEKKELTFKSNAAFSDFIRVELDGKTLDEKNYTVKEGSTVVTLKADYVATLSAGEHTIGIVSESGTASTTFTVNAKAVVDNDTKSPQTGDNSHMALWIALLFVSGAGVIGTTVYGKKKRAK